MYLINNVKILEYQGQEPRSPKNHLFIQGFNSEMLNPTSYYFRVGNMYSSDRGESYYKLSSKNKILNIAPNEYVLVLSYESFYLSDRTFAILGPSTDLQKSGLSLRYGQFIDPLFDGKLEVGIHNPFDEEINLKLGDKLGKLCFFDISDTYPITSKRVSDEYAEKLIRRQKMQEKYGIPTGIYDEDVIAFAREQEAYREFEKDDD